MKHLGIRRLCFASLMLATIFVFPGCTIGGHQRTLNAMINNRTKENYYIWMGEDATPPAGRAAILPDGYVPWQFTISTVEESDEGEHISDHVKMHASKDGKSVTTKDIDLNQEYQPGKSMYIIWDGSGFTINY